MAQLLPTSGFTSIHTHNTICTIKSRPSNHFSIATPHLKKHHSFLHKSCSSRGFRSRAFDTESDDKLDVEYEKGGGGEEVELVDDDGTSSSGVDDDKYPTGEFVYREFDPWESLTVKFKMLFALPWERVKKGSVLTMKIRGEVDLLSHCSIRMVLPCLLVSLV